MQLENLLDVMDNMVPHWHVLDGSWLVSWADLIAVAGAEAVSVCGGPEIHIALGRTDSV